VTQAEELQELLAQQRALTERLAKVLARPVDEKPPAAIRRGAPPPEAYADVMARRRRRGR
jgi:hypothetical protein